MNPQDSHNPSYMRLLSPSARGFPARSRYGPPFAAGGFLRARSLASCLANTLGKLRAPRFPVPLLERLRRDLTFDQHLGELSTLRLALERHRFVFRRKEGLGETVGQHLRCAQERLFASAEDSLGWCAESRADSHYRAPGLARPDPQRIPREGSSGVMPTRLRTIAASRSRVVWPCRTDAT
jgi:hypothetical protein